MYNMIDYVPWNLPLSNIVYKEIKALAGRTCSINVEYKN